MATPALVSEAQVGVMVKAGVWLLPARALRAFTETVSESQKQEEFIKVPDTSD